MKELEEIIIKSIYGESMYYLVSFLEPNDFTDPRFKNCFDLMQKHKATGVDFLKDAKRDKEVFKIILSSPYISGVANIQEYAVKLIETRIESTFVSLLVYLLANTKIIAEKAILQELKEKVETTDIFLLSDHSLEYIGNTASDLTNERITSFLKWRDSRIQNIKLVINGVR